MVGGWLNSAQSSYETCYVVMYVVLSRFRLKVRDTWYAIAIMVEDLNLDLYQTVQTMLCINYTLNSNSTSYHF
jgi:hypothetical protein